MYYLKKQKSDEDEGREIGIKEEEICKGWLILDGKNVKHILCEFSFLKFPIKSKKGK